MNNPDETLKRESTLAAPLLPLRDIVVFPNMVVPLFVGREKSIAALEVAMKNDKYVLLAAQKSAKTNAPAEEDIFRVGTLGTIVQLLRLPDGTVKVLVEGKHRAQIVRYLPTEEYFEVEYALIQDGIETSVEMEALVREVQSTFEMYIKLNKQIPPEMLVTVQGMDDSSRLADAIVVHLTSIKLEDRQSILEEASVETVRSGGGHRVPALKMSPEATDRLKKELRKLKMMR